MFDEIGKAIQGGLDSVGTAVRKVADSPANALEHIPVVGNPLGGAYRVVAQSA